MFPKIQKNFFFKIWEIRLLWPKVHSYHFNPHGFTVGVKIPLFCHYFAVFDHVRFWKIEKKIEKKIFNFSKSQPQISKWGSSKVSNNFNNFKNMEDFSFNLFMEMATYENNYYHYVILRYLCFFEPTIVQCIFDVEFNWLIIN